MTSFIITGNTEKEQMEKAHSLCRDLKIDPLDITTVTLLEKEGVVAKSLGVEVVKLMQEKIFFKPLRGENKAVIIPLSHLLTPPAQNALLKLLEEPPLSTYIFLLTDDKDALLPTVCSRCQIITLENKTITIDTHEKEELVKEWGRYTQSSVGQALKTAEQLAKDKDGTLTFFVKLTPIIKEKLTSSDPQEAVQVAQQLQSLQDTYTTLRRTNANPRLVLEHLFLNLVRRDK